MRILKIGLLCLCISLSTKYGYAAGADDFVTTWQTTTPNETITIPLGPIPYNFTVDWGDGSPLEPFSGTPPTVSHTYATAGIYQVRIDGTFPRIHFNNSGDKDKILSIDQWGSIAWANFADAFEGATNLTYVATDAPDLSAVTDLSGAFKDATSFNGNLSSWDVSNITSFSSMFEGATSFNGDITTWNIGSAVSIARMFLGATSFNQNINSWTLPVTVTSLDALFQDAISFNQDLNNWNVSNISNFASTFRGANNFNGNIDNWNTGSALSMSQMFNGAINFNRNISGWDVSNVTTMGSMFRDADNFNQPIGAWTTTNLQNTSNMFTGADIFNQDLSNWDMDQVSNMGSMFDGALAFNGNISGWNTAVLSSMDFMFRNANTFNRDLSGWNTSGVSLMRRVFENAVNFNQSLASWDISNVTNMIALLDNSGLSTNNYDLTLRSWNAQAVQNSVTLGAFGLTYCNAETDRQNLIATNLWPITGDSKDCTNASTAPTAVQIDGANTDSQDEGSATNTNIGTLTTIDVDGTDTHTYSLACSVAGADDSHFNINTNQLRNTTVFNFGSPVDDNGDNTYEICVRTTDNWGLSFDQNLTITINSVDSTPPTTPVTAPDLTTATDSGSNSNDNITNDNTPDFTVACTETGSTITLYSNNPAALTILGSHNCVAVGPANITATAMTEGNHNITYTETDAATNQSAQSPILAVTIDTIAPANPTITSPTSGAPAVGIGVTGTTITATTTSGATCTTTVLGDGSWSCNLVPVAINGENINVVSTDTAGNTSGTINGTINLSADGDGDGAIDTIENSGFNGGDGDGDGNLDSTQVEVSTLQNPATGNSATLKITPGAGTCTVISNNQFITESTLLVQDLTADYPVGLVDFEITCGTPGDSVDITVYYTQEYNTTNWVHKKYDSLGNIYSDISGLVTYGTANVGGTNVTTATYTVTDGDPNTDEDGVANGTILDPSGPAVAVAISLGGGSAPQYYPVSVLDKSKNKCVDLIANKGISIDDSFSKYQACLSNGSTKSGFECTKIWALANNFQMCPPEKPIKTDQNQSPQQNISNKNQSDSNNECRSITYNRKPENRGKGIPDQLFNDTLPTNPAYSYLVDLAEQEIIHGDDNTGYARLEDPITRAETVKIMTIAREDTLKQGSCGRKTNFPDVDTADWHHNFVENLEYQNIVHGYDDGFYRPGRKIIKSEIYKIAALSFGYINYEKAQKISMERNLAWYVPYIEALEQNVSLPKNIASMAPDKIMKRKDIFTIISIILKDVDRVE